MPTSRNFKQERKHMSRNLTKKPTQPAQPDKEIAQALSAIAHTQDAILAMLWSIRDGVPNASFLDDSRFKGINIQQQMAIAALRNKYGV